MLGPKAIPLVLYHSEIKPEPAVGGVPVHSLTTTGVVGFTGFVGLTGVVTT